MEAKKHTAGEMLDRYIRDILPQKKKSHRKQILQLRWWKEQIGSYLLADITPSLILETAVKPLRTSKKQRIPL